MSTRLLLIAAALTLTACTLLVVWSIRRSSPAASPPASTIPVPQLATRGGMVTLAGTIREVHDHEPLGDVDVAFRGAREASARHDRRR